ncbi:EF-hand domain-containing protein [Bradyrhizobium sp. HKCCYLS20291]|uniref:EF-hand domain-containing protein n=1 Tax=Bradyrhizobium sp. HKCCYLS20291 TaxID=3420766 RepID=UPI003EB7123B
MSRQQSTLQFAIVTGAMAAMMVAVSPVRAERRPDWAPPLLLARIQAGATLENVLEQQRNEFLQLDADGDGRLTARDVDLHGTVEAAQARHQLMMGVLRYDLNGDGFVTEDEIRRMMRYELRFQLGQAQSVSSGFSPDKQIDSTVQRLMALDADKDGWISMAEAAKPPAAQGNSSGAAARTRQTLDAAGKDEVTLQDYLSVGEALFRKVDADGNGTISQQEATDYTQSMVRAAAAKKEEVERAGCDLPAASDNAKVLLFGGYEAEALSNVTLGSQDVEVRAGRIVIEPGSDPLYIVVPTHRATIWQVSGAVERIERIVATSMENRPNRTDAQAAPLAGVTGVAAERVSFLKRTNCLSYFSEAPSSGSLMSAGSVRRMTGKAPDVIAGRYSVSAFFAPSGKIETVRDDRETPLIIRKREGTLTIIGSGGNATIQMGPSRARDEMMRFFPGGVVEIDPKTVVSSMPAVPYEVLPSQAGLVQLLASGALSENRGGEYIVRSKIRFPAGLHGAHSVTFLVMKGTPYPDGDPGHSCVIVEETGESKGSVCRAR